METNPTRESLGNVRLNRQVDARLRHLDVDDLYLLSFLSEGKRLADAARSLSLSQPAITQRIHKIEQALGVGVLERSSRATRLTEEGLQICQLAGEAMFFLERFFDGRVASRSAVAVSSAWAAWLMASVLSDFSEREGSHPIDLEYVSPEWLSTAARSQDGFGPIVATLHHRTLKERVAGYSPVSTLERPITLWVAPGLDVSKLSKSLPLIEVTRDERLLSGVDQQSVEQKISWIKGVRYSGTVAGAIQLAAKGQGVLVAPALMSESSFALEPIELDWPSPSAVFDLLVDERAPTGELVQDLIKAIAK